MGTVPISKLVMRTGYLLAACMTLTGCSKTSACYGLTDTEVLASIQRAYADMPMTPEMAKSSRLEQKRVVAVERFGKAGHDAFVGMLFRQDDGTLLSIRLFEDYSFQTTPGVVQADLKAWAYPLAKPRF